MTDLRDRILARLEAGAQLPARIVDADGSTLATGAVTIKGGNLSIARRGHPVRLDVDLDGEAMGFGFARDFDRPFVPGKLATIEIAPRP